MGLQRDGQNLVTECQQQHTSLELSVFWNFMIMIILFVEIRKDTFWWQEKSHLPLTSKFSSLAEYYIN